jgi:hypothetical protein
VFRCFGVAVREERKSVAEWLIFPLLLKHRPAESPEHHPRRPPAFPSALTPKANSWQSVIPASPVLFPTLCSLSASLPLQPHRDPP